MSLNIRKFYYLLTPKQRLLARRIYYLPVDLLHYIRFNKKTLQPPKGMIFTGSGDFKKQGETFLNYFIEYGNLKPDDSVLDIGSGIGRMAIPLTSFLSEKGKYEGFDIVKKGVDWCKKEITKKFPRFNFTHIELRNTLYNTDTEKNASEFKFPYSDDCFDFVFLISVFTHMLPADVENYFKEINRVLKPNGTCFATFFIIDDESGNNINKNDEFMFSYNKGDYSLMDEKVPEANVGYRFNYLQNLISVSGFKIISKHAGYWSGRSKSESLDFQDILIVEKIN